MAGTGSARPGVVPTLLYADAKAAIRQLTEGLGFTEVSVFGGRTGRWSMPNCPTATGW